MMYAYQLVKNGGHFRSLSVLALALTAAICGAQEIEKAEVSGPSSFQKAAVNRMIDLSFAYFLAENKDSAAHYAILAYAEGKRINYHNGVARALLRKSQIAKHFHDHFRESEAWCKESLQWYQKTSDKSGLDTLYSYLIFNIFSQGRYEEAATYARHLYSFAMQSKNPSGQMSALGWEYAIYRQSGDHEKSFLTIQKALEFAQKHKSEVWTAIALYGMGQLYAQVEDYSNSLVYFRKVLQMENEEIRRDRIATDNDIWFKMEFAEVFSRLGQFDSAEYYYNLFKPTPEKEVYLRVYLVSTGEHLYLKGDYATALSNFLQALPEHERLHDRNEVMRTLLNIGKTYLALDRNREALKYGRQGLALATETNARQFIRDGYQIISTAFDKMYQEDSANLYFRRYIMMKDKVLNDQAKGKMAAYSFEQKIAHINQEKELQAMKLKEASFTRKILIAGLALLTLFGFTVIRAILLKRKNDREQFKHHLAMQNLEMEKAKAELQHQASELEMKALRAQMNPHFIFNSLNSINRFILENNKAQASKYLTKFSSLIRHILQHSQFALVSLESELDALRLYLELEALRFDHQFDYRISVEENLDAAGIKVPPLLIQPYAENAIWHGLMLKETGGQLNIHIFLQEENLCCRIADNGVGRKKAGAIKSKSALAYKSMGMQITAERIRILQRHKQIDEPVRITDLMLPDGTPGGTEVFIKIPVHYDQNPDS